MSVWKPTLAIMCCHILTGTASVTTRYLVTVLDPVEIAFMRYLFGGFAMLPLFFLFRTSRLTKILLLKIAGLGALFFCVVSFYVFLGIRTYQCGTRLTCLGNDADLGHVGQ